MTGWTKDQLIEHRQSMGWPPLSAQLLDRVLAILNETYESMDAIDGVSLLEPDIRFSVAEPQGREE